jgi:hypothetical protein
MLSSTVVVSRVGGFAPPVFSHLFIYSVFFVVRDVIVFLFLLSFRVRGFEVEFEFKNQVKYLNATNSTSYIQK